MAVNYIYPEFEVVRNDTRCIRCRVCERQCANEVHIYDESLDMMVSDESKCVNCQRCVSLCPTRALKIVKSDCALRENANWSQDTIKEVYKQAGSGGVLLSSMGNPKPLPVYWDRILINASQVTNPSIDPLREPMETKVFLGSKNGRIERNEKGEIVPSLSPQLELSMPVMFSAMSYGSISYNAHESLARAATELGILYNTGEGGLHEDFYVYGKNTIVQVASGRFGVHKDYLETGAAVEIKMGQGAKPGIGGHLPGTKVGPDVSRTRMIPEGSDAISPAPHHDIYSIEDLRQLVYSLKEATEYKKPVIVKVAAVHNIAAIASGIARSGADIIAIDGFRGGTGAAPTRIRDSVGIPIELALAAVDQRLRDEGIRDSVSLVVGGSIRYLVFSLLVAFNALMALFVFLKVLGGRGPGQRRNIMVFLFCLTMTVAIVFQVIWPLLPLYALGCLIGSCFLHVFVIEGERAELRQAVIEREQAAKHMAEIEKALERARTAEKARSMFFSIVSHDIRTPLNAILGYSELLQRGMESPAERDVALKSIRTCGETLLQLVNDVLDLAKMDAGKMTLKPEPVNLSQLTDKVFTSFRMAASDKGIELVNRTADVPTVMFDEHRLRQILFNLIGKVSIYQECNIIIVHVGTTSTM